MSLWRRVAIEKMPGFHREIADAECPAGLWIELTFQMSQAYQREPVDESLISAIYEYGQWCLTNSRNGTVKTAALFGFYEELPIDPHFRADVGRWLSVEEFNGLKNIFAYHLSDPELETFTQEFLIQKKRLSARKL